MIGRSVLTRSLSTVGYVLVWVPLVALLALVASMGAAIATGLASGAAEPTGWRVALVVGLLAVYVAALMPLAGGHRSCGR